MKYFYWFLCQLGFHPEVNEISSVEKEGTKLSAVTKCNHCSNTHRFEF